MKNNLAPPDPPLPCPFLHPPSHSLTPGHGRENSNWGRSLRDQLLTKTFFSSAFVKVSVRASPQIWGCDVLPPGSGGSGCF